MTEHSPDQLRWQVTPILAVAIDAGENILVDIGGNRARVDNVKYLAEAVRQATAAQRGALQPEGDLFAELAALRSFVQAVAENAIVSDDFTEGNAVFNAVVADAREVAGELGIAYEPGESADLLGFDDAPEPGPGLSVLPMHPGGQITSPGGYVPEGSD